MIDPVGQLRENRKNPSVLKMKVLAVRSAQPNILVFIFEGPEDVGVYETWIARTTTKLEYEAIPGAGKEQLIALRNLLAANHDQLLRHVCFFVDCDFDPYDASDEYVFNLDSYSIENILCSVESLESLLIDEFRCTGDWRERKRITEQFILILNDFKQLTREINFSLFVARRLGIKVLKKPEAIRDIAQVNLQSIVQSFGDLSEVVELEEESDKEMEKELRREFDNFSDHRAQRGKYVLCMFRSWLQTLVTDRKQANPVLFSTSLPLSGDPHAVKLRRLASQGDLPRGLEAFLSRVASAANTKITR